MKSFFDLLLKVGTNPQLKAWAMKQMINLKSLQSGYQKSYRHSKDLEKVKDILDPKWIEKEYAAKIAYNLKNKVLDITKATDKVKWLKDQASLNKARFHGKNFRGWVDDSVKKIGDDIDDFFKKDAAQSKWFNKTLKKSLEGNKKAGIEIDKYFANIEKINREKVVPFWPRKKPYKVHKAEGGRIGFNKGGKGGIGDLLTKLYRLSQIGPLLSSPELIDLIQKIPMAEGGIAELLGEPRSGYGGRIGLAEGDTPSEAYLRKIYYKIAEGDQLGTTTFDQWKRSSSAEYWRDKWRSGNRAEGGRIGYDGGGPINLQALIELYMSEGMTHDEAVAAANKPLPFHILTDDKAQGGRIGFKDGEGIMSRVGDMVDVRNIPYYSGKALQGLVNSAETLSKFPFAAGELGSKLIQQKPKKEMFMKAIEDITPGSWSENVGLTSLVEGMGEKRPKDAQTVGGILGLGTEIAVPTGGAFKAGQFLLNKASKAMGKVKDGKTLNKLVEDKISDSGQSRRDFMSLVGASGLAAGLKWLGLGGLLKGATKKLDDIEIQVRGDADYEYIDEAWSGGTWANVYFKALTKKGKDILEKLTKGKDSFFTKQKTTTSMDNIDELYIPGNSEEAAVAVEKIIAGHKPNWRLNTATKQIYNPKTKSFSHPKDSIEGAYEHSKNYSGKDLNKKTIMKEADDLIASERSPYHRGIEVHDEFLDDILNQITTKKAEGGRIGLGTGGPPLQLGIAEAEWRAKHPVQGNKISQLKDAAMDRAFPGTGITGSLNMGNFEAFYNQPLIDPMNMFEKSQQPQYGLQYEKGPFSAGVGVMPSGETEYGFKLRKEFNDGGLTKTVPPKRGPMPQGLPSALYNGIIRPRSY